MFSGIRKTLHDLTQRRGLATGVVYISNLPHWCGEQRLYDTARLHSLVYGVWIRPPPSRARAESSNKLHRNIRRPAAIRIINTELPATIYEISKLPEPTQEEIEQIKGALVQIIGGLRDHGILAKPVSNEPDMFQKRAGLVMKMGPETRIFDKKTTSRPWLTKGVVDGYRKGFMKARDKAEIEDILEEASQSEDEMEYLAKYLEFVAEKSTPKMP
ncbi:hypothetical protein LPJ56_001846 [Coemansia sp. RSA 2599]|nr:hypothetical protein LPJ75_001474 [Coemansia sp. RSA 2598]KAJ1827097.1 hypothetical protein LPJ56_001846 [Coemansia sp. RSA 2599]